MRLGIVLRITRFIFFFFTIAFGVLIMNFGDEKEVYDYCNERILCEKYCTEDVYPALTCNTLVSNIVIEFKGNRYTNFYLYPESTDREYKYCYSLSTKIANYPYSAQDTARMWKVHTCFRYCRNTTTDTSDNGFTEDTRTICTTSSDNSLYCVPSSYACEDLSKYGDFCFDTSKNVCMNFIHIFVGIILGNIMQVAFEAAILYSLEMLYFKSKEESEGDKANNIIDIASQEKENSLMDELYFCGSQIIYLGAAVGVLSVIIVGILFVVNYGRPQTAAIEFAMAVLFDQVKAVIIHPLIWYLCVRRLGYLQVVGWEEWNEDRLEEKGEIQSLWEIIRSFIKKYLEHPIVAAIILGSVILLSFFIFVEIAMEDYVENSDSWESATYIVYYVLSIMFIVEIILKIIAYGKTYLLNLLNLLDTVVVLYTSISLFSGAELNSLKYLRLLRLFRIVLEMKEIADEKKHIQELIKLNKRQASKSLSPNLEKIAEMLESAKAERELPHLIKVDIEEKLDLIYSGKILARNNRLSTYDLNKPEIATWINLMKNETTPLLSKTAEESKGDSTPSNQRRASNYLIKESGAVPDLIDNNIVLFKILDITGADQTLFENNIEKIGLWNFESITYHQMFGEQGFMFITLKIFSAYISIKSLGMPLKTLLTFLRQLYQDLQRNGCQFHNAVHAIDMLQALHFFLSIGNMKKYFNEEQLFALLFACLTCDYNHPGYSNKFLIKTKHPLAVRYNDKSILENFHCASVFEMINNNDATNVFKTLSKEIKTQMRKLIIGAVLGTDMSQHFSIFTKLKSKLEGTIDFHSEEDLILIAQCCLKAAIFAKMGRVQSQCSRWMDFMMEEMYKEGEMEKQLGIPPSKFNDRESISQDKLFLVYIDIICRPFMGTFLILAENDISIDIIDQGIDVNRKQIANKAGVSA